MFICSVCEKAIGPKIKPVRVVTGTRPQNYHNEYFVTDEWDNRELKKVDSTGTEITSEVNLCPEDGEKFGVTYHGAKREAAYKPKFEEPVVSTFTRPLVDHMLTNALARTFHKSKRAMADASVAIPLVRAFVDMNPKFKMELE